VCGCDLVEQARTMADPRGAAVIRADGIAARGEWRCPRAGGAVDPVALPEAQQDALARVRLLCEADSGEVETCPGHYTRDPAAHRVVTALRWLESGSLALRDPHPTQALVDALDITQTSLAARERDDLRRARESKPKGGSHGG
jgi:hypothetical protein